MRWGAFTLDVREDGTGFTLLHGADAWADFAIGQVVPAGRFTDDADEVEHGFAIGGASCTVRHTVAEAWTLRWALRATEPANPGDGSPGSPGERTVELPHSPRLRVRPRPGYVCWAWAAGAEGLLAVAPAGRPGPVVGLRLVQGWMQDVGEGFALAPGGLALTPGRRWVGTLRADLYPGMDALAGRLPAWLSPLELLAGQPWEFRQPDHALVVEPPASTVADGDAIQVFADSGRTQVRVHSPRGLTALTLSYAPTLDNALTAAASRVLRGDPPVTPAGAFVVAEALARALISEPAAGERLLDSRDWSQDSDLLAIATGVVRGQRSGNARMVRAALRRLGTVHPQPGYGRVVMAAWLATLALGEDAREQALGLLSRPSGSPWVALELNVLNLRSPEVSGGSFSGLINALGGDLPGEPVGLDAVRQAQLVGLLQLCPEEWPMAQAAVGCAIKNARRLLAAAAASDFESPDDLPVLAWLALAESLI